MLGIDKENTETLIREKLTAEQNERFLFKQECFENLTLLPKSNLIVSNFSLPFCDKEHFEKLWQTICTSLENNGYFIGNFFGTNDDWVNKKRMTFLSLENVKELFKNYDIMYINEKEYDGHTAMGVMKHWDVIEVFAQYNKNLPMLKE